MARALFQQALRTASPPFAVLYLYGPGGIGKTSLLHEYARLAEEQGLLVARLDGRALDPSPTAFLGALRASLHLDATTEPITVLARAERAVLLVDTYEAIAPLDAWLRDRFLPELPVQTLVVLAGRNPPPTTWRADAAWRTLVRIVALRNLRPDESETYLRARGVPAAQLAHVLATTHGHPLALALVGKVITMDNACPECGAPLPEGSACLDLFHALLVLEGGFPGVPGSILHFYAVTCYNLQHPDSVGLTGEVLKALRRNLADALDGKASVAELRRRARLATDGPTRVRRRPGDPSVEWYHGPWPMNVTHVLSATNATYRELVEAWARAIRATLDAVAPAPT